MEDLSPNYKDPFINDLVAFVGNNTFQSLFENFFLTYAIEFDDQEEHKLRYYELYKQFQNLFERQLEEFCESQNLTSTEFMSKCNQATTADPRAKKYVDILLSSADYDTFVRLMKIMRPIALTKITSLRADGKTSTNKIDISSPTKQQSNSSEKLSKTSWSETDDEASEKQIPTSDAAVVNKFKEMNTSSDAKSISRFSSSPEKYSK